MEFRILSNTNYGFDKEIGVNVEGVSLNHELEQGDVVRVGAKESNVPFGIGMACYHNNNGHKGEGMHSSVEAIGALAIEGGVLSSDVRGGVLLVTEGLEDIGSKEVEAYDCTVGVGEGE